MSAPWRRTPPPLTRRDKFAAAGYAAMVVASVGGLVARHLAERWAT